MKSSKSGRRYLVKGISITKMAIDSLRERDRDCSAAFQCLIHCKGDHGAGDKQSPRLAGGQGQPCSPHPAQLSLGAHGCGGAVPAPRLAPTNLSHLMTLPGAGQAGRLWNSQT